MSVDSKELAVKFLKLTNFASTQRNKYINIAPGASVCVKGLSSRQLEILFRLFLLDQNNITNLAQSMELSKSTVSIIMNKLIKKGLVSRNYPKETDDKRKIYFYITDEGKSLLSSLANEKFSEFFKLYSNIQGDKRKAFEEASGILEEFIDKDTTNFHKMVNELMEKGNADHKELKYMINMIAAFKKICGSALKNIFEDIKISGSVTEKQFNVLIAIHHLKYNTVTKLENFFASSGSTISIMVLKLEKAGYIYKERNKCEEDHRITYLSLTPGGVEMLKSLIGTATENLSKEFEKRSESEREKINCAFDKLITAMS